MPSLFAPPPPGIYEYTEILTFHFSDPSVPASLSDETTSVGKVWAATLRAYLELDKTGVVWWALAHGAPQKAKLFIDWKTSEGREQFEASDAAQSLRSAWDTVTADTVQSAVYRFPHDEVGRKAALSSTHDTVSVLFTFKFVEPTGVDEGQLDPFFDEFVRIVMKSPGGVVATSCTFGWEVNKSSYCAAFRYLNKEAMELFLLEGQGRRPMEELRSRATGGVQVEYLETRAFEHGWQGSVDKTRPDNGATAAMFASIQDSGQGNVFSALRGA